VGGFVSVCMDTDLSTTNVRFLRVIRNINTNPDEYEATERGEVPANTTAIRKASDFSRSQINYRLASDRGTDFTDSGKGLLKIHPASVDDSGGFGPKSVELTQKGLEVLSSYAATDDFDPDEFGSDSEVISQLQARLRALEDHSQVGDKRMGSKVEENAEGVERVEAKLDELIAEVRTLRESEWGAVDGDKADNLDRVLSRAPAMMYAFTILLEIDIDEIVDEGGYDDRGIAEIRSNLSTLLSSTSGVSQNSVGKGGDSTTSSGGQNVDGEMGVGGSENSDVSQVEADSGSDSGSEDSMMPEFDPDGFE